MGTDGMRLFVDGAQVANRTDTTQGESYLGYWRVGGDDLVRMAERTVEREPRHRGR